MTALPDWAQVLLGVLVGGVYLVAWARFVTWRDIRRAMAAHRSGLRVPGGRRAWGVAR